MSGKTTEFGKLCKSYRALLGLNVAQLGKKIGISQPTVSRFENGVESPPFEYVKKSIEIYGIKDKEKQMAFLLSSLNSSEKITIPLNKLGPLRKEWLAALCILGDVDKKDPKGWEELLSWMNVFYSELNKLNPSYVTGGDPDPL